MDKLMQIIYLIWTFKKRMFYFFLDEVYSESQIKKNVRYLYGALLSTFQSDVGRRILMESRAKQDDIQSWCQLSKQHETDGNKNVRIKKLESLIYTVFHRHYKGGLIEWIQGYEDTLTELVILGQKAWDDDDIEKRCFIKIKDLLILTYLDV